MERKTNERSRSRERSRISSSRHRSRSSSRRKHRKSSRDRDDHHHRRKKHKRRRRRSRSNSSSSEGRSRRRKERKSKVSKEKDGPAKKPPLSSVLPQLHDAQASSIAELMRMNPTSSLQEILSKMKHGASSMTITDAQMIKPVVETNVDSEDEEEAPSVRELYIGNLPSNVMGEQLREFLASFIDQIGLNLTPGCPILTTWISMDGKYALCEFRTAEECNMALMLNGLSLLGKQLIFGRPKTFRGSTVQFPRVANRVMTGLSNLGCTPNMKWFHNPGEKGTAVAEPEDYEYELEMPLPNEATTESILMRHIPIILVEEQIKQMLTPFGNLKMFILLKTPFGHSTGAAIFEFEDTSLNDDVILGLHNFDLNGQKLEVLPAPVVAKVIPTEPCEIIRLSNVFKSEEVQNDEDFEDILLDMEEESEKVGSVIEIHIPQPKDNEAVSGIGNVYIRFDSAAIATNALKALGQRMYGKSIVQGDFYPLKKFEEGVFE